MEFFAGGGLGITLAKPRFQTTAIPAIISLMATWEKPISIADAISPVQAEPTDDVRAWHLETLKDRHKAADAGRFASAEAVRAVIRKFVRDG